MEETNRKRTAYIPGSAWHRGGGNEGDRRIAGGRGIERKRDFERAYEEKQRKRQG